MKQGIISWFDFKAQEGMIKGNDSKLYYFSGVAAAHCDYTQPESYKDGTPVSFKSIDNVAYEVTL
jgi:hypothetical protein